MKYCLARFILISLLFVNCNDKRTRKDIPENLGGGSISIDIPERVSKNKNFWKYLKIMEDSLGLQSLKNGFDSLQIRIWIGCEPQIEQHLMIIERHQSNWNFTFYSFLEELDDYGRFIKIKPVRNQRLQPQSEWTVFMDRLLQTGILYLPDYSKLMPNYTLPMDGDGILVEIGTSKKYRLYNYPSLGLNAKINNKASKLDEALRIIEKEFDYERPCENNNRFDQ